MENPNTQNNQSYQKGNVKYNYHPRNENKQNKNTPQKRNKENSTLIPIVAILSVVILAISIIHTLQVNQLTKKYTDILTQYNDVIHQNETLIQSMSNTMSKMAEKQPNVYVIQGNQPTETQEPTPTETQPEIPPQEFDDTAFLGITVDEETMGANPLGIKVKDVVEYSAAKLGGIQPNDIIMSFDNQTVSSMSELSSLISTHKAGDIVVVEFARIVDGDVTFQTVTIELSARGNFDLD